MARVAGEGFGGWRREVEPDGPVDDLVVGDHGDGDHEAGEFPMRWEPIYGFGSQFHRPAQASSTCRGVSPATEGATW